MDHTVTLDELKHLIKEKGRFYLIEAQAPMMYEDTHLPGALNLPPNRVAELAPRILPDKDAQIVVYCSGPT